MFIWKVEECKLMNENIDKKIKQYNCEWHLTSKEKITFIDSMNEGKLSYFLELKQKLDKDKKSGNLKMNEFGHVKTVSLKAWIKKNDIKYDKNIININFNIGNFYLLGLKYELDSDLPIDINKIFHKQLEYCELMEKEWFKEHDEYSILCSKVKNYIKEYNTDFELRLLISGDLKILKDGEDWKGRKLTIEELKQLILAYKKLENCKNQIIKEINIKY